MSITKHNCFRFYVNEPQIRLIGACAVAGIGLGIAVAEAWRKAPKKNYFKGGKPEDSQWYLKMGPNALH